MTRPGQLPKTQYWKIGSQRNIRSFCRKAQTSQTRGTQKKIMETKDPWVYLLTHKGLIEQDNRHNAISKVKRTRYGIRVVIQQIIRAMLE
jgi:hypothetical protein